MSFDFDTAGNLLSPSSTAAGFDFDADGNLLTGARKKDEAGGFMASAKQALGSTIRGAGQAAADFVPGVDADNAVKRYGQEVIDANPTAVQSLEDIAASPGMAAKEATGNAAGSMAGMLGARAAGMGITALSPLAGPAAPLVAGIGQIIAWVGPAAIAALPSYGGIRDKQILDDPAAEESAKAKAIAALGAGTVGAIETKFGPQQWALSLMTREGRAQIAKKLAETGIVKGLVYGAAKGGAIEGAEELVQNPIEQAASFQDPTAPENVKETIFGGAMGAIGGGVLGGGMGAAANINRPKQPADILDAPDVDSAIRTAQEVLALPAPGANTGDTILATAEGEAGTAAQIDAMRRQRDIREAGAAGAGRNADIVDVMPKEPAAPVLPPASPAPAADPAALLERQAAGDPMGSMLEQRRVRTEAAAAAQAEEAARREAELATIPEQAAEQNTVRAALERAGSVQAPTAMQLALERGLDRAIGPDPEPAAAAPALPRVVERAPGMAAMPQKLAEQRAAATGGEVVRIRNQSGKFAFTVIPKAAAPDAGAAPASAPAEPAAGGPGSVRPAGGGAGAAPAGAVEPAATWFGRRGDGYLTQADAALALPTRERRNPELRWLVERMPNGKFRLAGYTREVPPVAAVAVRAENTSADTALPPETQEAAQNIPGNIPAQTNEGASDVRSDDDVERVRGLERGEPAAVPADLPAAAGAGAVLRGSPSVDRPAGDRAREEPPAARADGQPAGSRADAEGVAPARYGRDSIPIAQGGKPFPTREAAERHRKKNMPQGRVVKHDRGFVLRDPTDAETAARTAAGRRLQAEHRAKATDANPLLAFLAEHGLFHDPNRKNSLKADFSPDADVNIKGFPTMFRADGLQLDALAEYAEEAGFLPPGNFDTRKLSELIQRALAGQRIAAIYAEGVAEQETERARLAEGEAVAALGVLEDNEVQALADPDADIPWDEIGEPSTLADGLRALGATEQEIEDAEADPAKRSARSQADAQGGDGAGEAAAGEAQGADRGRDGEAREEGLTSPTPEEVVEQQERRQQGERAEAQRRQDEERHARADAERDEFTLTGSDRPADVAAAGGQQDLLAEPAPRTVISDLGEKIGGARKDTATSTGTRGKRGTEDTRPAWARRFKISQIARAGGQIGDVKNEGRWSIHDSRSLDRFGNPKQVGGWDKTFATQEEAEAALPLLAVAMKHRAVPTSGGKYEIWRDVTDRKRVKVVDREFASRDEAMLYMAQHAVEIIETNTTFGEADLPLPPDRRREGPQRRQGDVTGDDFMATFGFRGVEFGNWNNQDERQALMNDAYDGLLDLADVLGVPPKALGLNGDLALAFGARGQGLQSARAHYERDRAVINLTKESGAGSLAHEWFHGLDHYFGRQDGKASSVWEVQKDGTRVLKAKDRDEDYVSHGFGYKSAVRPEVRAAYEALITTIFKKATTYQEDTGKADAFTARAKDDLARELDSLRKELSAQKDPTYWKRNNKPASAEQLAEFDAIARRMLEGEAQALETDWRSVETAQKRIANRWTNDSLEQLGAIFKAVRGRSGFDSTNRSGTLDRLQQYMRRYSERLRLLADAQKGTEKTRMVPTEFAMNAKELDQGRGGDYWTTPHEMAARAFQGYVEDKIAERGGVSRFLNYAPENAGILTPWGVKRPYPHGAERKAINAALDNFVQALETEETDTGVRMFARGDDERMPSGRTMAEARAEIRALRFASVPAVRAMVGAMTANWTNGPQVHVVATTADLPLEGVPADVRGLYTPGNVYVVAGAHKNGKDLRRSIARTLSHEAIAHWGLREMLGREGWQNLMRNIQLGIKAGNKELRRIQAYVRETYVDEDGNFNLNERQEADEIAAKAVEDAIDEDGNFRPGFAFLKSVWAKVAQFLRDLGIDVTFTNAELQGMLVLSMRNMEAGERTAGGGQLAVAAAREDGPMTARDTTSPVATEKDVAGTNQGGRSAGDSTGGATAEQLARIFDESRWLDRGLKVGAKTKLYRGEDSNTGKRSANEGRGLYVTTDRDQAKGYGSVREMSHADLPKNPLRFRDVQTFDEWRRFVARELGFRRLSEFEQAYGADADTWIRALDPSVDGVQIGTGPGTFFVKFPPNEPTASEGSDAFDSPMQARSTITGNTNRQYTAAQRAAMRNVGFETDELTLEERAKALWKDAGKKMAQGIVDQFAPVKDLDAKAYGLLRLSRGASGAFETFLRGGKLKLSDGVYDFDENDRGGVVEKLLIPLQGEHHDFFRWIAANRAERLMSEGREHLFTAQDIAALKTLASGTTSFDYTIQTGPAAGTVTRDRTKVYADSQRLFNEFNKNVLDMAEQSGLIDVASRKLWEHEFYVPFYRVMDEADGGVRGMNIKGGMVRQQAFKHLKGGKEALNADLLDNTLMNWAHLLDAAAKNRAAKATLEAAERMGVAIGAPQYTAQSIASATANKNGIVWFMDGGVKRFFVVDDPFILTAITALEYAGMRNPVMNAMSTFKHVLTIGVTASPFFKVRNLIRDSVQVLATSPIGANPLANVAEGFSLTKQGTDEYFRLLAGGGTIRFGTMLEGSEAKRVQALVESGVKDSTILNADHKVKAFYRQFVEPAITAYNELGNRGEAVNRASLYAQLRRQGMTHAEASLQARDLMDFSMQGSWTTIRFLTQVVPFLNARLQGLYKLGRGAKEDPQRFAAVLGAATLFTLALWAAYEDDEDWKKREEWDRNNYWWFKFGGTAFRIPKPFEIGAIATLAERGAELFFDKEMTGERFRKQVLQILSDQLAMNPVPQLVKPVLDVYSNRDSFSGRPIETMGMERLQPQYRFTDRTSMTARAVGSLGGPSPVQVDHLIRGYFGWLGSFVVGAADVVARPATDQPKHPTPDYWKAATGGMVANLEDAPSRYVSQMYEQAKEIEQAYGTWRALQKQGKAAEAKEFFQDNRDAIVKAKRIGDVKRAESRLNEQIRIVERSNLDPEVKRERIRRLSKQKDRIARTASPA